MEEQLRGDLPHRGRLPSRRGAERGPDQALGLDQGPEPTGLGGAKVDRQRLLRFSVFFTKLAAHEEGEI